MANFSSIYEKLVDMGFANEAIDAAIKKGLYTFDMIFNELIETDPNLRIYSESNNYNKWNNMSSQPVLKLRANAYPSLFDGYNSIEDKLLETNLLDDTDSNGFDAHLTVKGDSRSFRSALNFEKESSESPLRIAAPYRTARSNRTVDRSNPLDNDNFTQSSVGVGIGLLSKVISSTISSSVLSSTSSSSTGGGEMPAPPPPPPPPSHNHNHNHNKMARIQIMDLLDPSFEPISFSHPFLSSICTIRDLICWFHQSRYTVNRGVRLSTHSDADSSCNNNRLAIPADTSLTCLIELFQQLKWHLVMPSGAQSFRIFGDDFLDKTLEFLELSPSAHLLAIISCPPSQLQRKLDSSSNSQKSSKSLVSMINGTDTIIENSITSLANPNIFSFSSSPSSRCCCCIKIEIIDLLNKPAYKLICDPAKTTLQRVALDFSCVCEMEIGSFTLFRVQPHRQMFTYPDDYLHSLVELGLTGGSDVVILHCHTSRTSENMNPSNHMNNSSGESLPTHIFTNIDQFDYRTVETGPDESNNQLQQPFPGVGITLPGSLTSKTVAEIWADRQLDHLSSSHSRSRSHPQQKQPKSLFHFSFQLIYRSLRSSSNIVTVCKSVRKLPNNIQQLFIKLLLEDRLLTPSLLSYFCTPGSCLTCLDLSYNLLATNELLKCVSKCCSLQELILDNEDHTFSNEGLWHLRYLSHLRRLSLNYCSKINDWGIQVVGELPSLSVLAIKYTSVTNVGLKHIYLHLSSENLVIAPPPPPPPTPPLRSIDLSGLTISDECLSSLSIFNQLELLNMSSTHISTPSMFPRLPELRHLDVSHCHELVWEETTPPPQQQHPAQSSLAESFPKLSSINVRGVSAANLVHITMAISHCKHIRQLDGILCHPQMTANLAASLSHLPLETIILTNCQHVTDLWLPILARFSPTLTHLVLSSCLSITGENNSLSNNLSRLRNLSWLDLTHLENVDTDQICQLLLGNYFPKLQVAWISLNESEESKFRPLTSSVHFKVNITRSMINCSSLDVE